VYWRLSSACSSAAPFCWTSAKAAFARDSDSATWRGPVEGSLRLGELLLRLLYLVFGGGEGGVGASDARGAGASGGEGLVVLLLRDFLLFHELPVAFEVSLKLYVVGFRLSEGSASGVGLFFGRGDARPGVFHVGLGGADLAGGRHRGNRNDNAQGTRGGLGICEAGACLINGNLVILGIDLHEHRALGDDLVVVHIDADDVARDARANGIEMSIHLGIVGGLVAIEMAPQKNACHNHHEESRDNYKGPPGPGASVPLRRSGSGHAGTGRGRRRRQVLPGIRRGTG